MTSLYFLVLINKDIVCLVTNLLFVKSHKAPLKEAVGEESMLLSVCQVGNVDLLRLLLHALAVPCCSGNHSLPNPFRIKKLRINPTKYRTMNNEHENPTRAQWQIFKQ
jgi:hypothetical protein